jgi:hypothetical protein
MALWELSACVEGWNKVHGGEQKPQPPTDEEFDAIKKQHRDLGLD